MRILARLSSMALPLHSDTWQLQEAKNRFSALVDQALEKGTQIVTRHGRPVVKVVPIHDDDLADPPSLWEALRSAAPAVDDAFIESLNRAREESRVADRPVDFG